MPFTPSKMIVSSLVSAVFLQACAPKPFHRLDTQNTNPPSTVCSSAIISEAIELKRDAILFPRQKDSYVGEGLRSQKAYNTPELTDYYFKASEFGRRGEQLRASIIETNCYVDSANEEMLGKHFEKLQKEIQIAMGPVIDFVNYHFYFDKNAADHGIENYACNKTALSDPELKTEAEKSAAFQRANEGLFLKFSVASKLLEGLLSEYNVFEFSRIEKLPENAEIKFQNLMAETLFFCKAVNSLDGNAECTSKSPSHQQLCNTAFEYSEKMGVANER